MKKIFLKYDSNYGYRVFESAQTQNYRLQDLLMFLEEWPQERLELDQLAVENCLEWIEIEKNIKTRVILFWSRLSFKNQLRSNEFKTAEEELAYIDAYATYFEKRWNEVEKLEISFQNYEKILQEWEKINKEKPVYLIVSQNSKNEVGLIGKNELSQQDLYDIKLEHEKCLKREAAYKKYQENNPNYNNSDEWRSPLDDEFEADIMKYYKD